MPAFESLVEKESVEDPTPFIISSEPERCEKWDVAIKPHLRDLPLKFNTNDIRYIIVDSISKRDIVFDILKNQDPNNNIMVFTEEQIKNDF